MYHYLFINYNKYTTLTEDVNNWGKLQGGGEREGKPGNSVLSAHLFCKPKTSLKYEVY